LSAPSAGLVDADLGGASIKQRVARKGQGEARVSHDESLFEPGDFSVFLFGFAKSDGKATSMIAN